MEGQSVKEQSGKGQIMYSIIVVCLNAGEKLLDTVESILAQGYRSHEIIVKDGCSSDGSIERLRESCRDERLRICVWKDTGIYDAMDQAIEEARGTYLLFLNAGDSFYGRDVLGCVADAIAGLCKEGRKADIVYGDLYHKALHTTVHAAPSINDFTCYRNVPCHQTCFYHRSMFAERGYDPAYTVRADYEHFLWCYYERHAGIYYVPVVVAAYEGGGYSETKENKRRSRQQHREIVVRYMGKKKADRYRLAMLLTLAPLRSAVAGSRYLSGIYDRIKAAVYRTKG